MRVSKAVGWASALAVILAAMPAQAYKFNDWLEVYGYAQVWWTIWEQMEDAQGLYQYPSHDEAADVLSGFSLARARVGVRLTEPDWNLSLHTQVQLDHSFALLDADLGWTPARWFSLHLGQFKVPGTYEALTEDRELDFILRADITTNLADYSLAKAAHPVSLLYGSVSQLRDLGLALKGEVGDAWITGRYYLMVGDGLGANMYFGGLTKKEYFITNKAQFYWGGRLEAQVATVATLGLFGSWNKHDNIVFNSGRAVYDIGRRMIGGDVRVEVPYTGLRLGALGGGGQIRDDFNGDGKVDLRYLGWAISAVWNLFPVLESLTGWRLPERHAFELSFRFDRTQQEMDESGITVRHDHYTMGASYTAAPVVKVQLNYIVRHTDDPTVPETANNVLFLNVQAAF
jgi:hypothetical protein